MLRVHTAVQINYRVNCPICDSTRLRYLFISYGYPICRCMDCNLLFRNPQPSDEALETIYAAGEDLGDETEDAKQGVVSMRMATARLYLKELIAYTGRATGELLEIGCGTGEFLAAAQNAGFEVMGLEKSPEATEMANARLGGSYVRCGTLDQAHFPRHAFDVCVLCDVLGHLRDPLEALERVHAILKPGGVIFLTTPSLESWSAKLMGRSWMELKLKDLTFFSPATIENALARIGFQRVSIKPNEKIITPEYVYHRLKRFEVPAVSDIVATCYRMLPRGIRRKQLKAMPDGMRVLAQAAERSSQRLVSIIMPVFNERPTVSTVLDSLLQKELPGVDKEIIVVESNSSDGTREEVLRYQDQPGVRIILESKPRGKGHAVRAGLSQATGEFVLIQDADLEYDINDYDALLEPLLKYRSAFILGIRHGDGWKLRKFTDNPWQAVMLNLGHIFFTTLINVLYGQRMKDPFTMFKVFRRDCIGDLGFECNGFDFDHELVIKMVRKGYRPLEIPVNYQSRSFKEGKKVRFFRDPLRWLWIDFKFRVVPIRRGERRSCGPS